MQPNTYNNQNFNRPTAPQAPNVGQFEQPQPPFPVNPQQPNVAPNTAFNAVPGQAEGAQFNQFNVTPNNFNQESNLVENSPQGEQMIAQPVATPVAQQPAQTVTQTPPPMTSIVSQQTQDPKSMEREWVGKTKTVIESTRTDPYEQAHQIAKLIKDYLKVRYGKEIGR